jgi:hypothetical protein
VTEMQQRWRWAMESAIDAAERTGVRYSVKAIWRDDRVVGWAYGTTRKTRRGHDRKTVTKP